MFHYFSAYFAYDAKYLILMFIKPDVTETLEKPKPARLLWSLADFCENCIGGGRGI
jgi:hypothetical protein